ncbi:MAG: DNA gyrase inhibitor YacG [Alphaproteobacteria bacterium]|nr:DNA gyrase inhibitor YacG [Alphaproteobacteria bacterium]
MSRVVELKRKPPKSVCPMCKRPTVSAYRPFCSPRCKDEDMRRWLEGGYRIPTSEAPEGEEEGA